MVGCHPLWEYYGKGAAMPGERDTYRYTLRVNGRPVYYGITNDPERRAAEHKRDGNPGEMHIEGPRVTRESALAWERERS